MILGMCGKASSGKDTVADILVRDHGFCKIAMADPLKRLARDALSFDDHQLWGPSSARNAPDKRYPRDHTWTTARKDSRLLTPPMPGPCACCGIAFDFEDDSQCYLTPRYALQTLGTEWGRGCYDAVWVEYAMRIAQTVLGEIIYSYDARMGLKKIVDPSFIPYKGVVISDVRFPNEVKAVRAAGGIVWRTTHGEGLQGAAGQHVSESHIDNIEADATVPRQADLATLPAIVAMMLKGAYHA